VLDFRVRPHDSKLEASRGIFDEMLTTEKGKRQRLSSWIFSGIFRTCPNCWFL